MTMFPSPSPRQTKLILVFVLCLATWLRLHELTSVPPGLTHDEADHALSAWGVVEGIRPIYFTVGYGREPLFDYLTAGLMSFLGATFLASRLTAVYASLLTIAATYTLTKKLFNTPIALLTISSLTINFWALIIDSKSIILSQLLINF